MSITKYSFEKMDPENQETSNDEDLQKGIQQSLKHFEQEQEQGLKRFKSL